MFLFAAIDPDIINNKLTDQLVSDGVSFINSNSKSNDQVVIISDHDSVIYLETKTSSAFQIPGFDEMTAKTDWEIFNNSLLKNNSFKVFLADNHDPKFKYVKILKDHYYLDGWFGVRIEDDFLVNQEGHEFLTADLPRDLDWFMIEKDDYEALEWHTESGEDDDESGLSEVLPAPLSGLESIMLLTLIAAALGRGRDELSEIEME